MVAGRSEPLEHAPAPEDVLLGLSQIEWQVPLGEGVLRVSLFDPTADPVVFSPYPHLIEGATLWGAPLAPDEAADAALLYDQRHHPVAVGALQMREQSEYHLEVSWQGEGPAPQLRCFPLLQPPVMRLLPTGRSKRRHQARLNFRDFVGATSLQVYVEELRIFDVPMEVRSRKLDYLDDYVALLDAIAAQSVALLLRLGSPVSASFLPGAAIPVSTALIQMLVLRHVIRGGWLAQAIEQVAHAPLRTLTQRPRLADLGRHPVRSTEEAAAGFRRGGERVALPEQVVARLSVDTQGVMPRRFVRRSQQLAYDTPENRFVQSLFGKLETSLHRLHEVFSARPGHSFVRELQLLQEGLEQLRGRCHFLRDVPPLVRGEVPRHQLQMRRGYRALLEIWDLVDMDIQLAQESEVRDEVMLGPLRDLAGLYEIWCYFALWEALAAFAQGPSARDWLQVEQRGAAASLSRAPVPFWFAGMRIYLSYQRRFQTGEGSEHSYSVALTPDFTIEVLREGDERVLLCFDAKYRPDGALEKMHAYRDALRGALGCYLFYPGQGDQPTLFHRHPRFPLPGVGAFPLRPSSDLDEWLSPFLRLCLEQIAGIPIS